MIEIKKLSKIIIVLVHITISVQSQAQSKEDSVIISAMQDELNRNMNELRKEGHDKPFFISYSITDINTISASASLGALTNTNENNYKDWGVRVMVGDYERNDENFVPSNNNNNFNRMVYQMPIENDYMGIRMALWSQTDMVYNSAASLYKQKKSLIEEKKFKEKQLKIDDFSKEPTVKIRINKKNEMLELPDIEKKAKLLSEVFQGYTEIYSSNVSINQISANAYFINSEKTEAVYPLSFITINIVINAISENNESLTRNLAYNGLSPKDLPENDIILNDIKYMIDDINESKDLKSFEDYYSGPVLFMDAAATDVLESALFKEGNKLIAHREQLKRNDQFIPDYNFEQKKGKTWKIEEKVIDANITVVDYTSLKEYDGVKLWGYYNVDAEGVVPPDSIILIEKGILRSKYNDRTPTEFVDKSNGHKRPGLGARFSNRTLAPATLKIEAENTSTNEELKAKLIEYAKDEGYNYGIIIRSAAINSNKSPYEFFKVDVETGKETRLKDAIFESISDREFMHIAGISNKLAVSNKTFNSFPLGVPNFNTMSPYSNTGVPVSYIAPSAILIERVDVNANKMKMPAVKPVIKSPIVIR